MQDKTTPYKASSLQLISDLANYPRLVVSIDDEIYKVRVKRVFEAVLKGLNTYKMLLDDPDVGVREMAKEVLYFTGD